MALYNDIGSGYSAYRKPDARIAAAVAAALGDATSVANIGAGTGSYEPTRCEVIAVEPSEVMIRQRPPSAAPCVRGRAEEIPLGTGSVDAAMTVLSAHHWSDLSRGLREMRRVARRRVVMLTWVPDAPPFWLTDDYFPEILAHDRTIFPSTKALVELLHQTIGPVRITQVAVPHDCTDGFLGAYWRRPAAYLDRARRGAISSFARIDAAPGLTRLEQDLSNGRWDARHGHVMMLDELDVGYRLICCELESTAAGLRQRIA